MTYKTIQDIYNLTLGIQVSFENFAHVLLEWRDQ
jgi:hypothetical protein